MNSNIAIFTHRAKTLARLVCVALALGSFFSCAPPNAYVASIPLGSASVPSEPILRDETGMHVGQILSLSSDAAGKLLLTGSLDKTARLWSLADGHLIRVLRPPIGDGQEGEVSGVALSPDGTLAAVTGYMGVSWDGAGSIYVFDTRSGQIVNRLKTSRTSIFQELAFTPDGQFLAAGGVGQLAVWHTGDWAQVTLDTSVSGNVMGLAIDRSGRLALVTDKGSLRLYDSAFRLLGSTTLQAAAEPRHVAFSPDGGRIAIGFLKALRIEVRSGRTLEPLFLPDVEGISQYPGDCISDVAWSADGHTLYGGGSLVDANGRSFIRAWGGDGRARGQDRITSAPGHAGATEQIVTLPERGIAYASGYPSWGTLDSAKPLQRELTVPRFNRGWESFLASGDGDTVAFPLESFGRQVMEFSVGERKLAPHRPGPTVLLTPASAGPGMTVTDWDFDADPKLNGRSLEHPLGSMAKAIPALAACIRAQHLVVGDNFGFVRYFDSGGHLLWWKKTSAAAKAVNISGDGRMVLAASADGRIHWFRAADGSEILALLVDTTGRNWVLSTPSGYYDASPGAEALSGWHVNRGKDTAAEFYPLSRFLKPYFRPDVVSAMLASGGESEGLRRANADLGQAADLPVPKVLSILPPAVTVLAPADGTAVTRQEVELKLALRYPEDAPASEVRVRVNGLPATILESRVITTSPGREEVRTLRIPLAPQDAEIQVFGVNRNAVSEAAVVHVTWAGSIPRPPEDTRPTLFALAIGVSQYERPEYRLGLAAKDAGDFARLLQSQKGRALYRDVQVRLVTDADARRAQVLAGLDWLKSHVTERDTAILYLAGHGLNDPQGDYYYLPTDADVSQLPSTGIEDRTLLAALAELRGRTVVFVDTCHAGDVLQGHRGKSDNARFLRELGSPETGVAVLAASTGTQFAEENPAWGNGAFTKALVEGLSGGADARRTGRVTMLALMPYVAQRVGELTEMRQTPTVIIPNALPDFPLVMVK
jgi:WD40 repeat protein